MIAKASRAYAVPSHPCSGTATFGDPAHRAMGSILPEHRDGLPKGWEYWLERIRELAESKNRKET